MCHYSENAVFSVWLWLATARRSCQVDRPLSQEGMCVILGKAVGHYPWDKAGSLVSTCCSPSQGRPS